MEYGKLQTGELPQLLGGRTRIGNWKEVFDEMTPGSYRVYPADYQLRLNNARTTYSKPGEFGILFTADKEEVVLTCKKRLGKSQCISKNM